MTRGLTAELAESYGSMSLTLEERPKSRAKRGALLATSQYMFASQHFCSVVFTGAHGVPDLGKSSAADPGADCCEARCSLRQGHLYD